MDRHPIEDLIRASVAAVMAITGENLRDVGEAVGLADTLISRRQRGLTSWHISDLGRLADHWGIPPHSLISGPSDAVSQLGQGRIRELRDAKSRPVRSAAMAGAAT